MSLRPLADTLLQAVDALRPPIGSSVVITEAEIDLPLELWAVVQDRRLVIAGSAPHTRFVSGVLPPVHRSRLHIELLDDGETSWSGRDE